VIAQAWRPEANSARGAPDCASTKGHVNRGTMVDTEAPAGAGPQREGATLQVRTRGVIETHQTLIGAVIAAIASIVVVLLTVALNDAKEDTTAAQSDVAGLQQQVEALQRQVELRDSTIKTLEDANAQQAQDIQSRDERIEELEAALGAENVPVPEAGAPPIRHQGEVTLANGGDRIDVNAPASDPVWGAGATSSSADYIAYSSGYLYFSGVDVLSLGGGETASYETCSTRTGYGGGDLIDPATLDGLDVCVRASSGRYAAVRLTGYNDDSLKLDITTWELA
jgi:hypothetical protein